VSTIAKGRKAGGGVRFGRNSSAKPSTGGSIKSYGVKNMAGPGAVAGGMTKGTRLGNPSGSMTKTGRFGSRG
jgi:hypothetical protein